MPLSEHNTTWGQPQWSKNCEQGGTHSARSPRKPREGLRLLKTCKRSRGGRCPKAPQQTNKFGGHLCVVLSHPAGDRRDYRTRSLRWPDSCEAVAGWSPSTRQERRSIHPAPDLHSSAPSQQRTPRRRGAPTWAPWPVPDQQPAARSGSRYRGQRRTLREIDAAPPPFTRRGRQAAWPSPIFVPVVHGAPGLAWGILVLLARQVIKGRLALYSIHRKLVPFASEDNAPRELDIEQRP